MEHISGELLSATSCCCPLPRNLHVQLSSSALFFISSLSKMHHFTRFAERRFMLRAHHMSREICFKAFLPWSSCIKRRWDPWDFSLTHTYAQCKLVICHSLFRSASRFNKTAKKYKINVRSVRECLSSVLWTEPSPNVILFGWSLVVVNWLAD